MDNRNNDNIIIEPDEIVIEEPPKETFETMYGNNQQTNNIPNQQINNNQTTNQAININPQTNNIQPNINYNQQINTTNQQMMNQNNINPQINIPNQTEIERMQSIEEQLSKTSQYNPEDLQQEKIIIPNDNQYEKNKSGLSLIIILFVILLAVIILLPHITKLIK